MSGDALGPPEPPSTTRQVVEATVRGALGAVPLAGAALVEAFDFATTRGREQRLQQWMKDVAETLQQHGVLIAGLANNDSYLDAIGPATRAAIETVSEEKRLALRAAVLNAALPSDLDADERATLVDLVARLTPAHLRLLRILDDPDAALEAAGQQRVSFYTAGRAELVKQVAPDLAARPGFLAQLAGTLERESLANPMLSVRMTGNGVYERSSTDLGRRLIDFVTEPPTP